jgi:hypothetical protein
METSGPKECKGCSYFVKSEVLIPVTWLCDFLKIGAYKKCPCRICLVKTMCNVKVDCDYRKIYRSTSFARLEPNE